MSTQSLLLLVTSLYSKRELEIPVRKEALVNMAHLLVQPHQNYNYNIKQLSLRTVRNLVEWKSDNYRIKETIFIQTGRRGRDAGQAGPTSTHGR